MKRYRGNIRGIHMTEEDVITIAAQHITKGDFMGAMEARGMLPAAEACIG